MKKLVWVIVLGLVGYFVYTQFFGPASEEEQEVKALERRFASAQSQYMSALRQMGSLGIDATSDADDAIGAMKKVKKELLELKDRLTEADAVERAEKLEAGINIFFDKNDIK
jgi:molecular chaperone GrpE (heat shock protein)